jgi:glycosyltransferase involved in cell wall biosynthesis
MRVLFVTHNYPRYPGDSAGSFLHQLALALGRRGMDVHVLAPAGPALPAASELEGIAIERFRYAPRALETLAYSGRMVESFRGSLAGKAAVASLLAMQVLAIRRRVMQLAPAVLHCHWWFPSALAAALAHSGRPLVTTFHGTDIRLAARARAAQPLLRYVVSKSAVATTVSRWLARELQALARLAQPFVAPMPAAVQLFGPGERYRQDRSLLFVGRLSEQKGLHYLLQAMPALEEGVTLDVVGDGPQRQRLLELSRSLGLEKRVRWHGALPQTRLPAFYQGADLVVVPSIEEGFGLVAVEAQLCETPVVAFASGGLLDVIEDGVTGYLTPPGDPSSLARVIARALNDPRRIEIGKRAREVALERYSPDAVAARYAQLYDLALGGTA